MHREKRSVPCLPVWAAYFIGEEGKRFCVKGGNEMPFIELFAVF